MKRYLHAPGIWVLIIPIAILNRVLREGVLVQLGSAALPLSGLILSAGIFLVAYFLVPTIKDCRARDYVVFGLMWFVLTNLFDLTAILRAGGSFGDLVASYEVTSGNL